MVVMPTEVTRDCVGAVIFLPTVNNIPFKNAFNLYIGTCMHTIMLTPKRVSFARMSTSHMSDY